MILQKPDVVVQTHPGGGLQEAVVREGQVQRSEHGARRDHDEPQDPRGHECVPGSLLALLPMRQAAAGAAVAQFQLDRKSTRLNSSHVATSYAVFCLKKKTATDETPFWTTWGVCTWTT